MEGVLQLGKSEKKPLLELNIMEGKKKGEISQRKNDNATFLLKGKPINAMKHFIK